MSRLVRKPSRANSDLSIAELDDVLQAGFGTVVAQTSPVVDPDTYLGRIAKYVPGEVLAFFVLVNAILEQTTRTSGKAATMAGIPIVVVAQGTIWAGIIMVPLFVWYVREEGDAWLTHALVSTLLFPFWTYLLGAVAFSDIWDGNLAAILLATMTILTGLITPPGGRAPRKPSVSLRERAFDLVGPRTA